MGVLYFFWKENGKPGFAKLTIDNEQLTIIVSLRDEFEIIH